MPVNPSRFARFLSPIALALGACLFAGHVLRQPAAVWSQPVPGLAVYLPLMQRLERPTGAVLIEDGRCCIGGIAGQVLDIHVTFTATSRFGPVTHMRTGPATFSDNSCVPGDLIFAQPWEPFAPTRTFPFIPPINWSTFGLSAQYRDARGIESEVACDEIAVEGMPGPPPPPAAAR